MSDNIKQVPLNPMGAIELKMRPCDYCQTGWGTYNHDSGETKSCHDKCEYLKQYIKEKAMRESKTGVNETDDGQLAMYNQVVCPCCHGCGYQHNIQTNINEPCKCCDGSGTGFPGKGNIKITTKSDLIIAKNILSISPNISFCIP